MDNTIAKYQLNLLKKLEGKKTTRRGKDPSSMKVGGGGGNLAELPPGATRLVITITRCGSD